MSFDAEEGCLLVLRNYRGGQREDEEEEDVEWKFDEGEGHFGHLKWFSSPRGYFSGKWRLKVSWGKEQNSNMGREGSSLVFVCVSVCSFLC